MTNGDLLASKDLEFSIAQSPCSLIKRNIRFEDVSGLAYSDKQSDGENIKKTSFKAIEEEKSEKEASRNMLKNIRSMVFKNFEQK